MVARSPKDPLLGRQLNHLQLVERVGKGGFGAVYRATHTGLGTPYAIKILNVSHATDEVVIERFSREARAMASLQHDNVAQVFDFGQWDQERHYLVMEFLEGETLLQKMLAQGELLPISAFLPLLEQTCAALTYIHHMGIVHRDLKPSNIFLLQKPDGSEQVKLIDFGIAQLADDITITQSGVCMGSPKYMAPEQAEGLLEKIDAPTDLYALATMLYQLLTGHLPLPGKNFASMVYHKINTPARPLSHHVADRRWHGQLEDFFRRSLSKSPDARPADAQVFWQEARSALLLQMDADQDQEIPATVPGMLSPYYSLAQQPSDLPSSFAPSSSQAMAPDRGMPESSFHGPTSLVAPPSMPATPEPATPEPATPGPATPGPMLGTPLSLASEPAEPERIYASAQFENTTGMRGEKAEQPDAPALASESSPSLRVGLWGSVAFLAFALGVFVVFRWMIPEGPPPTSRELGALPHLQPNAPQATPPAPAAAPRASRPLRLLAPAPPRAPQVRSLPPKRVRLRLDSRPRGAVVWRGRRRLGKTPLTLEGFPGQVLRLALRKRWRKPRFVTLTLTQAAQQRKRYTLRRRRRTRKRRTRRRPRTRPSASPPGRRLFRVEPRFRIP